METLNILDAALGQLQIFMLEAVRISSIFLTAPLLGSRNTPALVKISFSFLLAMLLYPVLDKTAVLPADTLSYFLLIFKQVMVGVAIGFAAYILFAAIQLSGQIIDLQMGFGIVNVLDPMSNTQVSIIGQFQFILGMLIFLSINGHHYLFQAVTDSFRFVPLTSAGITEATMNKFTDLFYNLFMIAFKIAGPATLALILTNVTLGLIARTIPQMNVFIVGLPLNILVGLVAVLISLPILVNLFSTLLNAMWDDIYYIIKSMRV
jgi:flagellar biosynthetic protein FliR